MDDDIVTRLRSQHSDLRQGAYYSQREDSAWDATADAADEIERLRAELQQSRLNHLTTLSELQDAAEQSRRLRAERTAERALADRLAVALQEMFDPSLRDATHDEVIGVWKAAQDTLAGWEEARRG